MDARQVSSKKAVPEATTMKGRESGMPEVTYWESFFDPT